MDFVNIETEAASRLGVPRRVARGHPPEDGVGLRAL